MSSSFAPPPGPPPPTVPEGWKAQFDDRYNAWFYVNLATGKSQWEHPQPPTAPPTGPPPSELPTYDQSGPANPSAHPTDDKKQMSSNNPYNPANSNPAPSPSIDEDARLAAKLQAEEDARANSRGVSGPPGAASDYYGNPGQAQPQPQSNTPPYASASPMPEQKRSKGGFLSKLMGKSSSSSSRPQQPQYGYPQQQGPPGGYYGGGGYPQQPGYGGYPQPGYGGYGGPPPGGYYQQQPPRRTGGGGMGTAGAAALGVGGGLLGGMMLENALDDHDDYNDGYAEGYDDGGGGDFGGGDDF
ncbi:hypothetical protein PENSTE_c030G04230 [Penicillium steckii]|uniref:WW domain-containing protein n=1 Tax=Penicillium steckii TaxID=303698 RepID=A0A1V6SM30_9EURO|nr:hypothetical protein PENSTE_c030G04230 [Penicillium steckii]